mgnify:CR=1 FL=1
MTALLAKATALALVQHPAVNAACKDGKSFTYNANINIAVAVAMDGGLITPVLQDADKVHKTGAQSLASEEIVELLLCEKLQFNMSALSKSLNSLVFLCTVGYLFSLSEVERASR